MHRTSKGYEGGPSSSDFIYALTARDIHNVQEDEAEEEQAAEWQNNPSPLAGRIGGSMEELERLQGSENTSTNELKECIRDSLECYGSCTETLSRCLSMRGKHAEPENINLLLDCAAISSINADFILRQSTYHPQTCGLTADICDECADNCERFEENFMHECAKVCRRCAESCRELAR
jgi:hypothetical protein